ncbi:hypothetical protein PO909_003724 [Leuciscus waleckii]
MASRKRLIQFLETHDLVDIWRNFHKTQRQYTWVHSYNNRLSFARLDRFYGLSHQLNLFRDCSIIPVSFSDHSLVQCFLTLGSIKPKSAMWHYNNSLLADMEFRDIFKFFWNDFRTTKSDFQSLQQWWDFGKTQIKQLSQQYAYNITKETNLSMTILEDDIKKLQESIGTEQNQELIEILNKKNKELAGILDLKARGALIRSRFKNIEWMDVSSKFFFNLEKKNGQKRSIHVLRSKEGALLSDRADIRKRAVEFYKELYSSELMHRPNTNVFIEDLPQVTEEANADLCREITLEELRKALQGMECGRAPGVDGLSVDFYKSFWPEIGADLHAVIKESLSSGRLPLSCRRAVLTLLLPKKGDLSEIKNWRPVSLLCSDYKILSKALANRLSVVLEEVIHTDQTYCVPGRQIFDNISLVRDMFDISKLFDVDFGLVSLDQEKAFDRIEHSYLWEVLEAFGFSTNFIDMIKVLYEDIESILKINGGLSAPFKVGRGIRQGCSMSGMLYSIALEPMLSQIRESICGFKYDSALTVKMSAYADDIIVLVNDQQDINRLTEIVENFGKISSSKVNWSKSSAFLMGDWKAENPILPGGMVWANRGFKYLGVFLGDETTMQKNWENVLERVQGRLGRWKWLLRKMSFRGRILVINNLVASMLWHRLAVLEPPVGLLEKIQTSLVNFFWDKLHWLPKSVVYLPVEEGGQGLIHLASRKAAFRLQFVKKRLYQKLSWTNIAFKLLSVVGKLGFKRELFWTNSSKMGLKEISCFYEGVRKSWSLMKITRSTDGKSLHWLMLEPLINGSRLNLSCEIVPWFEQRLKNEKIITMKDLVEVTGWNLSNTVALTQRLGLRSERVVGQMLKKCRDSLSEEEWTLLYDFSTLKSESNAEDLFPVMRISPDLPDTDINCPLTMSKVWKDRNIMFIGGKSFYKMCVKVLNKEQLMHRSDNPWRCHLSVDSSFKPMWGTLYKPPLTKFVGDLQWRIMHGIIAVNAFISILNPLVKENCAFCEQRETIFHCFVHCV